MTAVTPTIEQALEALKDALFPQVLTDVAANVVVATGGEAGWTPQGKHRTYADHLRTQIRVGVLDRLLREAVERGEVMLVEKYSAEGDVYDIRRWRNGQKKGFILTSVHQRIAAEKQAKRIDRTQIELRRQAERTVLDRHADEVEAELAKLTQDRP